MRLPLTLNIQTGRKLADKSKDEILSEIKKVFLAGHIRAVQICYDTVRVTFYSPEIFKRAKESPGLYLFGLWCNILGGGPPVTVVNLFDYPFEGEDAVIEDTTSAFGEIQRIKHQSFVSDPDILTGTRLVSIVLNPGCTLPRFITINGCICRIWYHGQPLICNLCAVQGHKSVNCPNKDKCRRCGESGHFARNCPSPWGNNPAAGGGVSSAGISVDPPRRPPVITSTGPSGASNVVSAEGPPVLSEDSLAGHSVDSLAGLSAEAPSASGAPDGPAASAESSPEIGSFSSQSQGASVSDPEIHDFSSQSQDSPPSTEESQSILRNLSKPSENNVGVELNNVGNGNSNIENTSNEGIDNVNINIESINNESINNESINNESIINEGTSNESISSENINESISSGNINECSMDNENENPQSKNVVAESGENVVAESGEISESSMELDASGPSTRRPVDVANNLGAGDSVGRFLSRIPQFSPRKLMAKAQKPSKSAKFGQGKHSKLPVVLPSRPGRK